MIELNRTPSTRDLRQFALVWFPLLCGSVGWTVYCKAHAPAVACGVWAGGAVVAGLGTFFPSLLRPVFVGLIYLTFPIGWAISHIVLAITYFAVLSPVGLLLRLVGKDPLTRRFDRRATTYWNSRVAPAAKTQYFRQF